MVKIKKAICVAAAASFILISSQFAFSGTTKTDDIKSGVIVTWTDKSGVHHFSNLLRDKNKGKVYIIESELPRVRPVNVKSDGDDGTGGDNTSSDGSVKGNININIKQLAK